jgi:hypothetical protein
MTIVLISVESQQYKALASNRFNRSNFVVIPTQPGLERVLMSFGGIHRIDAGYVLNLTGDCSAQTPFYCRPSINSL